ncbi:hypothetical protein [Robertmurraya siralis]|uniref:hypothetical protein n=1 Tax=Robertmurraya siralis TaxID=77777 RepID=UPI0010F70C0E|nr:hypothetical protein [Robertmurraya siralis]
MNLREAMEIVIADFLEDNQGGIGYVQIADMSTKEKRVLASNLVSTDEFLERLTGAVEDVIGEYFNDYGDEYEIYD